MAVKKCSCIFGVPAIHGHKKEGRASGPNRGSLLAGTSVLAGAVGQPGPVTPFPHLISVKIAVGILVESGEACLRGGNELLLRDHAIAIGIHAFYETIG